MDTHDHDSINRARPVSWLSQRATPCVASPFPFLPKSSGPWSHVNSVLQTALGPHSSSPLLSWLSSSLACTTAAAFSLVSLLLVLLYGQPVLHTATGCSFQTTDTVVSLTGLKSFTESFLP